MGEKKKKLKKNKDKLFNIEIEEGPRGNPAVVETYEDARENAMINRDVPTMKNGGNTVKPIKAVLGVAALATRKGRDTLKKFFKGKKEVFSSTPGMAAVPTTIAMNQGGGMDMGKMPNTVKPRPRGNPGIVENVVGKGADYIKDLID
jgi:hypothetical protein